MGSSTDSAIETWQLKGKVCVSSWFLPNPEICFGTSGHVLHEAIVHILQVRGWNRAFFSGIGIGPVRKSVWAETFTQILKKLWNAERIKFLPISHISTARWQCQRRFLVVMWQCCSCWHDCERAMTLQIAFYIYCTFLHIFHALTVSYFHNTSRISQICVSAWINCTDFTHLGWFSWLHCFFEVELIWFHWFPSIILMLEKSGWIQNDNKDLLKKQQITNKTNCFFECSSQCI